MPTLLRNGQPLSISHCAPKASWLSSTHDLKSLPFVWEETVLAACDHSALKAGASHCVTEAVGGPSCSLVLDSVSTSFLVLRSPQIRRRERRDIEGKTRGGLRRVSRAVRRQGRSLEEGAASPSLCLLDMVDSLQFEFVFSVTPFQWESLPRLHRQGPRPEGSLQSTL